MQALLTAPVTYWELSALAILAYVYFCARAAIVQKVSPAATRTVDVVTVAVATFCFAVLRWPTLFAIDVYIDESQMLAQAITAAHDPTPWVSFDGTTSGPLNTYALLVPHLFGVPITVHVARIVSAILALTIVIAQYFVVRPIYGPALARVSLLIPLLLFGLGSSLDLRMYPSELLPICLMMLALAAGATLATSRPPGTGLIVAAGVCCGAIPFAKLQGSLLAGLIWFLIAAALWRRSTSNRLVLRSILVFGLGTLVPAIILLVPVAFRGGLHDFYVSYIAQSSAYVANQPALLATVYQAVPEYRAFFPTAFIGAALLVLFLLGAALVNQKRHYYGTYALQRWVAPVASLLLFAVGWYSVHVPQRDYAHYWLLIVMPLTLVIVSIAGMLTYDTPAWLRNAGYAGFAVCVLIIGVPIVQIALGSRPGLLANAGGADEIEKSAVAQKIAELKGDGRVAIWGYSPQLFVDSNALLGTRDSIAQFTIEGGAFQPYYRTRFLSDLQLNRPELFVDSTGDFDFAFHDRKTEGMETFPELAAYVKQNYDFVTDFDEVRIFRIRAKS